MKRCLLAGAIVVAATVSTSWSGEDRHRASAEAYEHLANALIEMRATEDRLVEGILNHHCGMAIEHLNAAIAEGSVGSHAKAAADEITNIANEGNKQVQAVRQKLLKAGHHHHTDAETEEDYMFIDSGEKKELLDLAQKVAMLGDGDVKSVAGHIGKLSSIFETAMKPE
jgi:hypothetical protein